jgi:hypothetical protein
MIWFKNCPRCNGDLSRGADIHGEFISCMQCGCILNEQQERALFGLTEKPSHSSQLIVEPTPSREQLPVARQKRRAA